MNILEWEELQETLILCEHEFDEEICNNCYFLNFEMVGHPGGGKCTVERHYCELGFWKEDF